MHSHRKGHEGAGLRGKSADTLFEALFSAVHLQMVSLRAAGG